MDPNALAPATRVVAGARPARTPGAAVNPPLVLSSTYVSHGTVTPGQYLYARSDTETWHGAEDLLGQLEGAGRPAALFASGMAAAAAVFALVPPGGRVIIPLGAYQVVATLARELAERGAIGLTEVDIADTAAVTAALRAGGEAAALIWIESPTNPLLQVADIPALARAGHECGALVAVDNTFATPLAQRPLELGADLVVHSVSKYLAGHSDVVLGAVVAGTAALDDAIRAHRTTHGAIAGPFEAWLALRGMRTLALRVERSQASAATLARQLAADPRLARVRHPSLPDDPGHALAASQMDGFGSIIAIELPGDGGEAARAADAFVAAVRLWLPATSLGGVESSLERRRRYGSVGPEVPEGLVRLSVGIEDPGDLWDDLDQALAAAAR
jgi:cystathionine gamma-synthase